MNQNDFINRLTELRLAKGVSAREMSLDIGLSENYINGIEIGKSLPSMTVFFYICDYLGITPKEFFDIENTDPTKTKELVDATKNLTREQLNLVIDVIKSFK